MTKTFPEKPKNITKAILDGDILAYRSAFATQDKTSSDTEEVIDELMEYVVGETIGFYSEGALKVYLTGKNNFRHEIAKTATYKGHRKKMEPPEHLPHAREYLQSEWGAVVVDGREADDAIATEAFNSDPLTTVICSIDKDMLTIPGWYWNFVRNQWIFSTELDALLFFYGQILTGDNSDNIIGLRGIGPKKSLAILEGSKDEFDMFQRCLKEYEDSITLEGEPYERLVENARLLHLQRYQGELWEPPEET